MKIEVDQDACEGHNRCFSLAAELFDVADYGTATALNGGVVAEGMEDKAHLAIANCPEHAISIVDD